MKTEKQISSGGIIFRRFNDSIDVALIAVKGGTVWRLPKGLVEKGENIARTAHREVKEETGLDGKIIKMINHIQYFYAHKEAEETKRFFKIVYFFLMEYTDGDVKNHDNEVNDCQWFQIDEAIEKVEYENEKEMIKRAKDLIKTTI
ncbi:MAG: NUDIX domain-containing protein [Deltaproteobacteria bacterium]|nr:NUDIX domain-containing protein [Deltaproteobacteria bacterium]